MQVVSGGGTGSVVQVVGGNGSGTGSVVQVVVVEVLVV